jgi:diaminopimelate epimerase
MKFSRYHALGNDYLVMEGSVVGDLLSPPVIQRICHRNFGIGSDGILVHEPSTRAGVFKLRILNPDGSEAEKSGNGLRIFARYLFDNKLVAHHPFTVETAGGDVSCLIKESGRVITVDMGTVSFLSDRIPVTGEVREVLNEELVIGDRTLQFCAATVGNPHCVILNCEVSEKMAREVGPIIETHPRFPHRTNVQLLRVLDRKNIAIEIWERGAGYTLASGSSSSASAAVAHRLGLVDPNVTVHMPGGQLTIAIDKEFAIRMTGPVTRVSEGTLDREALADIL